MKTVWVIFWRYSDGSSFGVVKAYKNTQTAEEDLEMLREHCDGVKVFELIQAVYSDA